MVDLSAVIVRRIAVIGDVHTDDGRLDVALRTIADLQVEAVLCTGDIVDGPGSAARCCALLQEHRVHCVRGNHDRWLFTGVWRDQRYATAIATLAPGEQDFLRGLPAVRDVRIPQGRMLLCHGIGDADLEAIRAIAPEYFIATNPALAALRAQGRYQLMVSGHTHERLRVVAGELLLVNVGSLCGPEQPGFAVLDFDADQLTWYDIEDGAVQALAPVALFGV